MLQMIHLYIWDMTTKYRLTLNKFRVFLGPGFVVLSLLTFEIFLGITSHYIAVLLLGHVVNIHGMHESLR